MHAPTPIPPWYANKITWKSKAEGGPENPILLVHRGVCQFLAKARAIGSSGGSGAVVVNTDDAVIAMPSGGMQNTRTHMNAYTHTHEFT